MKKLVVVVVTVLSIVSFLAPYFSVEVSASAADFSVQGILPDTQKNKNVSYFDFELLPGETKEIEVEIVNNAQEERLYALEVNTATTNMNGVIDYTKQKSEKDSSLLIDFIDIATVEPTILIPAGEIVRAPIQLVMPDKTFDGILLGGITVTEVIEEEKIEVVTNQFSYSVGIVLSQGDITPAIELNFLGILKTQVNNRNVLAGTIQNSEATIVDYLTLDAHIYRKGQEKPLFTRSESGLRMAPNSNFDFGIGTNNQPIRAGKYIMAVNATVGEQNWEWSEEFEITANEASELNTKAIELETDNSVLYMWLVLGLVGILLLIIVFLYKKTRSSKQI